MPFLPGASYNAQPIRVTGIPVPLLQSSGYQSHWDTRTPSLQGSGYMTTHSPPGRAHSLSLHRMQDQTYPSTVDPEPSGVYSLLAQTYWASENMRATGSFEGKATLVSLSLM